MIRKVSNVEFVVPTVFAAALAIVLSFGAVYLAEIFLGPIELLRDNLDGNTATIRMAISAVAAGG